MRQSCRVFSEEPFWNLSQLTFRIHSANLTAWWVIFVLNQSVTVFWLYSSGWDFGYWITCSNSKQYVLKRTFQTKLILWIFFKAFRFSLKLLFWVWNVFIFFFRSRKLKCCFGLNKEGKVNTAGKKGGREEILYHKPNEKSQNIIKKKDNPCILFYRWGNWGTGLLFPFL